MNSARIVNAFLGMGDSIYLAPSVRQVASKHDCTYITTAWPILFQHIPNLRYVKPDETRLVGYQRWDCVREQLRDYQDSFWHSAEEALQSDHTYVCRSFELDGPVQDTSLHVPLYEENQEVALSWLLDNESKQPLVLIHIPVYPIGQCAVTRDCDPKCLLIAFERCRKAGFGLLDVGQLSPGTYRPAVPSPLPTFHSEGVDGLKTMIALVNECDGLILPGSSHILAIAQALGKPCLCFGGGGWPLKKYLPDSLPEKQRDALTVEPDPLCQCGIAFHDCNKYIPDQTILDASNRFVARIRTESNKW